MKTITLIFVLLIGVSSRCFAQDTEQRLSPSHVMASSHLVSAMNPQKTILASMLDGMGQDGLKREVIMRIMKERINWQQLSDWMAKVYAQSFTEEELNQLTTFYQSDIGKKWSSQQSVITKKILGIFTNTSEVMTNMFIGACAAGVVAEVVESSQRMQIKLGQKPAPVAIDTLMEQSMPLIISSEKTCNCVVDKALAKSEVKDIRYIFTDPKVKEAVVAAQKECPAPY